MQKYLFTDWWPMTLFPFFLFAAVAIIIGLALLFISKLLGIKHNKIREYDVYESGVDPVGPAVKRYDIKFFLTAILFLLFDVEVIFLFPWALIYKESPMKTFLLAEFAFFMFIFLIGYIYALTSGGLKWED